MSAINEQPTRAASVTPSAVSVFNRFEPSIFYIGGEGSGDTLGRLRIITEGGDSLTFFGCKAGTIIPVKGIQVVSGAGTGVTDIIRLF